MAINGIGFSFFMILEPCVQVEVGSVARRNSSVIQSERVVVASSIRAHADLLKRKDLK